MHPVIDVPPNAERSWLSDAEIRFIIGASSTLAERLEVKVVPTGTEQSLAAKRLERWKRFTTNDDAVAFRRALGVFGLGDASDEHLCRLLGGVRLDPGQDLPRWAALLQEIVRAVATAFSDGYGAGFDASRTANRSVPFVDLYRPIVALARQKVETLAPQPAGWMLETAWRGLEHHLLDRLAAVCSLALQWNFLAFMAVRRAGSMPLRYADDSPSVAGRTVPSSFRAFVRAQGRGGLRDFFLQYPVAARLVAEITLFWIEFVAEFLGRLQADSEAISARFFAGRPVGSVTRILAGLSDPHHRGKSVLILDFENGGRLVYKPRPVGIDAAFCELLDWLNARGQQPPLRSFEVLVREGYGWESFVRHTPCRSQRDARRFYQRAGALLYLIHRLCGTDIHCENLIATGEGPVVVDLEALCHPAMPLTPFTLENKRGERWMFEASVFRTNMLPIPAPRVDRAGTHDFSALGALVHQRTEKECVRWKNVNSDRMEAVGGGVHGIMRAHRPYLRGRPLAVHGYREDFVRGFERMSRFLESNEGLRKEWRARAASMHALETRLIRQPTMSYAAMIDHSLQPALLVSGIDRSIELRGRPRFPGAVACDSAEAAAMETLDVPYFNQEPTEGNGPTFVADTKTDLTKQIAAIRAAFGTEKLTVHHYPPAAREPSL